jgi:hypothetical protein
MKITTSVIVNHSTFNFQDAANSPIGLFSARDFLTLRSYYKKNEDEYVVLLRSVQHKDIPEHKDRVRAHVYITGYYLKNNEKKEANVWMMTQADIKGYIPNWVVNWAASTFAPQQFDRLHNVVTKYGESIKK